MDDLQRAIDLLRLEGGLEISGNPRRVAEFCEGIDVAISAMQELQQYRAIGTLEECREARKRQQAVPARKTTIFEGKDAEKLAVKGLPNYETYKCPKCGRSVVERTVVKSLYPDGFIKKNYCERCGQAIDWGGEKE